RGGERARARGRARPPREGARQRAPHAERHRVERLRPIERDETRRTAPLEQDVARRHALAHRYTSVAKAPSTLRPAWSCPQVSIRPRVSALAASSGVAAMRLLTGRITSNV